LLAPPLQATAANVSKHVGLLLRNGGPKRKWSEEIEKAKGET
jgi:hypothetical protein